MRIPKMPDLAMTRGPDQPKTPESGPDRAPAGHLVTPKVQNSAPTWPSEEPDPAIQPGPASPKLALFWTLKNTIF